MGGPSGPTLLFQVAAIGSKSVGPEGPPTGSLQSGPEQACTAGARRISPKSPTARCDSAAPPRSTAAPPGRSRRPGTSPRSGR
ncbi:DUF6053 domain-containing protein [Lysobacter enzymogenes]|uniref:DUF6053 domain-containing protein n=1 Tax=Lysobacter enzymogenes TaxID=69 RepID=UPI003D2F868F